MGSKKDVFKLRSVRSVVIAPAGTGNDNKRRIAVMNTAQTNKGIWFMVIPKDRILITVVIKFTAHKIDDTPIK